MKFELILAYKNLTEYIEEGATKEAWNKAMIDPFWDILTEWAPFPVDYMKPFCDIDKVTAIKQLDLLNQLDIDNLSKSFEEICSKLPKDDEDTMHIAIYPSTTDMPEGIYGTGVWGNIILNINPLNENAINWILYVSAHEYHHCVWGDYWFCKKNGEGLDNSFLQTLITEGEADAFAKSLNRELNPSWHNGVKPEEELTVWNKIEQVMHQSLSPEERSKYIFGSEELGIPLYAGYYYAIRIIEAYLKKNEGLTFTELLKIAPNSIFENAQFTIC